jgi:hypothetical protein
MKPFTIWTKKVRYRRLPLNDNSMAIVISVTDIIHDSGWVGIQDTDGELFSYELRLRAPDGLIRLQPRGYMVT